MMIDVTTPFTLPNTDLPPNTMTITMLRLYVGGLDQLAELLSMLPDAFFHLPGAEQERGYEKMLRACRAAVGKIDLADLAEIGAEVCNG